MRKEIAAAALLTVALSMSAHAQFGRTQPIHNIVDAPIGTTASGKTPTGPQIEQAFTAAAQYKGWAVHPGNKGELIASINVRQHYAEIALTHTASTYSIEYRDSKVLMYDGKKIHRNYNKWIILLDRQFQTNLKALP